MELGTDFEKAFDDFQNESASWFKDIELAFN